MLGFISYSHRDRRMVDQFQRHLAALTGIDHWIDQQIMAGDTWEEVLLAKLTSADVVLLCVTPELFWSKYIQTVEIRIARERAARGECVVIPVILRDCLWSARPELSDLQAVPRGGKAVQLWNPRDTGYTDAVRAIALRVEAMKTGAVP